MCCFFFQFLRCNYDICEEDEQQYQQDSQQQEGQQPFQRIQIYYLLNSLFENIPHTSLHDESTEQNNTDLINIHSSPQSSSKSTKGKINNLLETEFDKIFGMAYKKFGDIKKNE